MSMVGRTAIAALALLAAACGSQQREAEPGPGEKLAAAPAQEEAPKPLYDLPPGAPPLPPDLLAVGSQEARDDLYCSALIYNEYPDVSDALAPVDEAQLRKAQALGFIIGEAGINRLVEEQAAHATHARAIAEAYAAQVERDRKANRLRISVDDCNARARAVPMPQ